MSKKRTFQRTEAGRLVWNCGCYETANEVDLALEAINRGSIGPEVERLKALGPVSAEEYHNSSEWRSRMPTRDMIEAARAVIEASGNRELQEELRRLGQEEPMA